MSKAITTTENQYAIIGQLEGQSLTELLEENFGPSGGVQPQDLDRISVPTGGAKMWTVETVEGEESVKTIEGVIITHADRRAYYSTAYDGSNNPPDCSSDDGMIGTTVEGDTRLCKGCPFDQWGSKDGGRGKACSQRKNLLVLQGGELLPVVISVPPSSIADMRKYITRLTKAGLGVSSVVTRLGLVGAQNDGGIKYSKIDPVMVRRLEAEELAAVRSYKTALLPAFEQIGVDQQDTAME